MLSVTSHNITIVMHLKLDCERNPFLFFEVIYRHIGQDHDLLLDAIYTEL